jgi:hypothetical protein
MPWLRYLDADALDDDAIDFDGMNVESPTGEHLGDVDGFIVDAEARRVNYVVIDSGGWFTSRRLLLPIGHATLGADRNSLQTDVTRDALRRLPEYDADQFREFSDEDLRAFERNTVIACCPDEPLEDVSVTTWGYDSRRHYTQPQWWLSSRYAPERLRPIDARSHRRIDPTSPVAAAPAAASASGVRPMGEVHEPELVTARDRSDSRDADPSPHLDGRAQPGDVLGIETGGERTGIGDTAEDENERRRTAERAAGDEETPRRR